MSAEPVIQGGIFEGLFERRLKPTGAFASELKAAGYDVQRPEASYPNSVFVKCVRIAARHVHPTLSFEQAAYQLGWELSEGYLTDTLAGKVVGAAIPLIGPDRIMKTLPSRMQMGTTANPPVCEHLGPAHWRVTIPDENPIPELVAGSIARVLVKTGVDPKVAVTQKRPKLVIEATWTKK